VLIPDRRDAFLAAAEISLAVESAAKSTGAIDSVATVGVCDVFPGAVNSIPSRVKLEIDVRDIDLTRRVYCIARNRTGPRRSRRTKEHPLRKRSSERGQSSRKAVDTLTQSCEMFGIPCLPNLQVSWLTT